MRSAYWVLIAFLLATPALAQVERDPAAVAVLQNAIGALGGPTTAAIVDCVAQASVQPTPEAHSSPYTITYENSGSEFRSTSVQDGKTVISASDGKRFAVQQGTSVRNLPTHILLSDFPRHLPGLVLYQRLSNTSYSLRTSGTGTVNGRPVYLVSIRLESETELPGLTAQVWSFDASTGLPLRVDYVVSDPRDANLTVNEATEFSNYQPVSGIMVPFQMTNYIGSTKVDVTTLTSVAFNTGVSPSDFQLVGGGQ